MEDTRPAYAIFSLVPDGNGTRVTWALDADMGANPFMHLMGKMMSGMAGKEFEKGLESLKSKVESMPDSSSSNLKIETVAVHPAHYLAIHDSMSLSTIGEKLQRDYEQIEMALAKQKLASSGPHFAIYYTDSQTNWEVDVAIPVEKPGKADGKIMPGEMKGGNAVVAHYFGPYMNMGSAYEGIKEYIGSHKLQITGAPWEVYVVGPAMEKDSTKWNTDIYFPIQ